MRTKWYIDAEIDRYSIAHFERCLRDVCHNFGIPELKRLVAWRLTVSITRRSFSFPTV
ncbi:MAG: hypothetical protein L0Y68_05050 [Candidatus Dadabacteria bacterium]|nr:hypothetical protein [Candidatus Dadabacteria bacterium]